MNATDPREAEPMGRSKWIRLAAYIVAISAAAYPYLFHRVAALDVGPYGAVKPVDLARLTTGWIVSLIALLLMAVVVWRLTSGPFWAALPPAIIVMWGLAFAWRLVIALGDIVSLPGQALMGLVLSGVALSGWLAVRAMRSPEGAPALLAAVAVPILLTAWGAVGFRALPSASAVDPSADLVDSRSDVWVLVLDGMPSPETMRDLGWDPTGLVTELEQTGFLVPDAAQSISNTTYVSLGSILSLQARLPTNTVDTAEQGAWIAALEGTHPMAAVLTQAGYEHIMVDNAFSFSRCGELVDTCQTRPFVTEMEWSMLANTLISPFMAPIDPLHEHSLRQFDILEDLATQPSSKPRLVYGHLLIPHIPFDLHSDCRYRDSLGSSSFWDSAGFREMMDCVTSRLTRILEALPDDAVVAVLGDHGTSLSAFSEGDGYSSEELQDRFSAFVAVRGCPLGPESLTSNVNAYRGMASCLTTTDHPPWPNVSFQACYESDGEIRLVDVTPSLTAREGLRGVCDPTLRTTP